MSERAETTGSAFWGDTDETEALQRYQRLVTAFDDGIYQLDADGRFVGLNDVIEEITGYAREELLGEHASVLFDGEDSTGKREIGRLQSNSADRTDPIECTVRTAGGGQVLCEVEVTPLVEDGTSQGSVGIVRDNAEGNRTESGERERRRENEWTIERQRVIEALEAAREGISLLDENGDFIYVNEAYADTFGYESEEMIGEHWDALGIEADPDHFYDEILPNIEAEGQWTGETTCVRSDESTFPARHTLTHTRDNELICVVRDVTERTEREQELQQYEHILETIEDGVYALDGDSRFLMLNEAFASMLGVDRESLIGEHVSVAFGEEAASLGDELQQEMIESETDIAELEEHLLADEGEIPVTTRFTLFEIDDELGRAGVVRDDTERKERERELREREQRLERYKEYTDDILDAIDDVFYVVDREGELKRWNESLSEVTGYTNEEIDGMHTSDFFDEEQQEAAADTLEEAFETGSGNVEMELHTKEGNDIPFEFAASTLEDPWGNTVLGGIGRDVTERVERQRALEESERRYRTLVEHFPNGAVALFDEDMRYTVAGGGMLEEVGTSADEIIGQTVWERYPEEMAERFETKFRAALAGEASSFEVSFHGHHWRAHTLPVRDDEGDIFAGMVMAQDITEQIEREQALQESKNQLQALIELLPVAVFVAEADGQIVEWNEAAEEIWGGEIAESDSIAEYEQYDGWWADTGEPVEADEWPLARALRGEEVTDPDVVEIEGFDGERRTVLSHGMPVRDADGEVSRAVVTLIDITERKEYQRKLEESNERLEQFAYAASHDLQEPLRMVSSYLQLIESRYGDELDEDGEEFIEFAVDGARRMRDMIEGLLEYSRVDTRGDPFEPVELNDVLEDVREDLRMRIEESDAEITAGSLPRVEGDEEQLRQVLQNLLDNAIEYSGDEPPRIDISAERSADEWVISVSDEGIGLDPDNADRAFEVFQSLHSPEEYSGTGIGLALCERIVERHGGDIWVESEPGEGATFSFTLPVAGGRDE